MGFKDALRGASANIKDWLGRDKRKALLKARIRIAALTRCTVLDPTPHSRAVLRMLFPLACGYLQGPTA